MMGLGAPIGPKFRDGAIWGAKPSPFGATRWTRGDVYRGFSMGKVHIVIDMALSAAVGPFHLSALRCQPEYA